METVPQLPQPHVFTCELCGEPMDLWDWKTHPIATADLPPAHCSACLVRAAEEIPKEQDRKWPPLRQWMFVDYAQQLHHKMRRSIGEPPGTVIAWEVTKRDLNEPSLEHPTVLYAVCVDWWDENWPQLVLPWRLAWGPYIVVFGAHVLVSGDVAASWRFLWQWHDPSHRETLVLDPPDAPLTKEEVRGLDKARGAFYTLHGNRGRPPRFRDLFEFYQATYAAVGALRKRSHPITPANVGKYLIERGPLTMLPDRIGKGPANPAAQFHTWCENFGFEAERLLMDLQSEL